MPNKAFIFRFADIEVREREFSFTKDGEVLPVEPKAFRVLLILLRNPQKLITKEELLNAVWGDVAVGDNSLARSIALLRRLLGDDTHNPRFIETVATVGYRFVSPVEVSEVGEENLEAPKEDGRSNKNLKWMLPGAAVLVACVAGGIWYLSRPLPPPSITEYTKLTHYGQLGTIAGIDESRLFLNRPTTTAQLSAQGGEVVPLDLPVKSPFIFTASPDGSSLLVGSRESDAIWKVGVLDRSIRLLTEHRVNISDVEFSPDGRFIAYSTEDGDIYRVNSDWTDKRILFSPKGDRHGDPAYALSWSPDGKRIRFTIDYEIWEVSSEGIGSRLVRADPDPSHYICCGKWTGDGAFYLFLSGDSLLRSATYVPAGNILALDERRSPLRHPQPKPVQLTAGPIRWGVPFSSKDSGKIFAQGVVLRGRLERYDTQSHEFQPFLGGISAEFAEFSKDGKSVAYVTYPEGILWKADADGSNRVQLTDPPIYPKNPRWSPDGSQILFEDDVKGKGMVYIVPSAGGRPQRLVPERKEPWSDPNWSPDGKGIVYASCNCVNFGPSVVPFIEILDLKTKQTTRIPGSEHLWSPRWSPNGRFIVALQRDRPPKLYNVQTQQWSELSIPRADFPAWSKNSLYIYFLQLRQGKMQVGRVPVAGGEPEKVAELDVADINGFPLTGWYGGWFGLDPGDAPLILRNTGTDDIYALTLEEK